MEARLPSAMPTASAVAADAAAARIPWMAPELAHVSLKYLDTVADVKWWVVRMLQLSGDAAANEPPPSMLVVDDLELFLESTFRIEGGQSGVGAGGGWGRGGRRALPTFVFEPEPSSTAAPSATPPHHAHHAHHPPPHPTHPSARRRGADGAARVHAPHGGDAERRRLDP